MKRKFIVPIVVVLAVAYLISSHPQSYAAIIPENLSEIEQECPVLFKKIIFCVARHLSCLKSSSDVSMCNGEFTECVKTTDYGELSESCKVHLSKSIDHIHKNGGQFIQDEKDRVIEEVEMALSPITSILFNSTNNQSRAPNRSGRDLSAIVAAFVPFLQDPSLLYREDTNLLEAALLHVEQNFLRSLPIPFSLWYGGLGPNALGKVVDRVLVTSCCGYAAAQKVNHAWAKHADCIEKSKSSICTEQFSSALEKVALDSIDNRIGCMMYVEAMRSSMTLKSLNARTYQFVDVDTVFKREPTVGILRNDQLSLLRLSFFKEKIYEECSSVKRTLSSCEFEYQDCEKSCGKDCTEKHAECLRNIVDAEPGCKKILVHVRGFSDVVIEWWRYIKTNPMKSFLSLATTIAALFGYYKFGRRLWELGMEVYTFLTSVLCSRKTRNNEPELLPMVTPIDNNENPVIGNNDNGVEDESEDTKRHPLRVWDRIWSRIRNPFSTLFR